MTNIDYIRNLIELENRGSNPHKAQRLEQLRAVLDKANSLKSAKRKTDKLTEHMSPFERTVRKRIADMREDIEDGANKSS